MNLYLAHPFDCRHEMRKWEVKFEARSGIEIVNPFYDAAERLDILEIDLGVRDKYDMDDHEIVQNDIASIANSDGIIAIIPVIKIHQSYGTIQEIVYANMLQKPVYLLCTNGDEKHPWLKYHATIVFTEMSDIETYLIQKIMMEED